MINLPPVTVLNVLEVPPDQLASFLNAAILAHKLPQYTPNSPVDVQSQIVPLLSKYANDKGYVTELYNIVLAHLFAQKKYKRIKDDRRDEGMYSDLEAKQEILYRTWLTLDRYYEAASRLMTGIGGPDPRQSRH